MAWVCRSHFILPTALQNNGMYIGVAFWPGGTVDDWGLVTDTETTIIPLDPCNKTNNYNNTGESSRAYLVRGGCPGRAVDTRARSCLSPGRSPLCAPCLLLAPRAMQLQIPQWSIPVCVGGAGGCFCRLRGESGHLDEPAIQLDRSPTPVQVYCRGSARRPEFGCLQVRWSEVVHCCRDAAAQMPAIV